MSHIVRFIPEQYLHRLRKSGELRLSTFERCRTIEDKRRQDAFEAVDHYHNEGEALNIYDPMDVLKNSNITITDQHGNKPNFYAAEGAKVTFASTLPNSLLLSCTAASIKSMSNHFGLKAYFTINDLKELNFAIINGIEAAGHRVIAHCSDYVEYVPQKNIKHTGRPEKDKVVIEHKNLQAGEVINLSQIRRHFYNYFTKPALPFQDEKEFRFVYLCRDDIPVEGITICLPKEGLDNLLTVSNIE